MSSANADVDPATALRGVLALLVADGDGQEEASERSERILAAAGLDDAQIASLRAMVADATARGSSAREESVIDRARAALLARAGGAGRRTIHTGASKS